MHSSLLYYEVMSLHNFPICSEPLSYNFLKLALLSLLSPLAQSSPKKEVSLSGWEILYVELFENLQVNQHGEVRPSMSLPC